MIGANGNPKSTVPPVRFEVVVTRNERATISPPGATVDITSGPGRNGDAFFCYSGPVTVVLQVIPNAGWLVSGWQIGPNFAGPVCAETGRADTQTAACTVTVTASEIKRSLPTGMVIATYPYVKLPTGV